MNLDGEDGFEDVTEDGVDIFKCVDQRDPPARLATPDMIDPDRRGPRQPFGIRRQTVGTTPQKRKQIKTQ